MPNPVKYKKAWNCKNCPQSNDENGCPMWWEVLKTNQENEEKELIQGCGYTLLPNFMEAMWSNICSSTAATENTRNEIAKGFGTIAGHTLKMAMLAQQRADHEKVNEFLQIEKELQNGSDSGRSEPSTTDPVS